MIYCTCRIDTVLCCDFIWYVFARQKICAKTSPSLVMDSSGTNLPSRCRIWTITLVDCRCSLGAICSCDWRSCGSWLYLVYLLPPLKTCRWRCWHYASSLFLLNRDAPLSRSQSSQTINDTCLGTWCRSNYCSSYLMRPHCCECCSSYGWSPKTIRNYR
jgi:hypothetical protein